jgi:predicted aspartyl protease
MVTGIFIGNSPFIQVTIGKRETVRSPFFVLDSGFTGDLQITPAFASDIGLKVDAVTQAHIADGSIIEVPVAFALAAMEGSIDTMEVLVSHGTPLVGINFLKKFGYVVTLDCKNDTVKLEKLSESK